MNIELIGKTETIMMINTFFESFSHDKIKTWSKPEMLLNETGGAPPHFIRLNPASLYQSTAEENFLTELWQ